MLKSEVRMFAHQIEAVKRIHGNGGNFAIFHKPGLGKTLTTLAALNAEKLLVICPLSLVNATWCEDVSKFTTYRAKRYVDLKSTDLTNIDIVIINYERFITAKAYADIVKMARAHRMAIAIDESSRLKNHKSITTKKLLAIAPLFASRVILSGTPAPNGPWELWAQMRFVRPDVMEKSFYQFKNTFFHYERNGKQLVPGQVMTRDAMRNMMQQGWKMAITEQKRTELYERIRPYCHWLETEDAVDLPEQVTQVREVQLSPAERKAYNDMKRDLVAEINATPIAATVALAKMMKLRQATSGFMYDTYGVAHVAGNSKMNELEEVVDELGDQQVMIFANFQHEIESIAKMLSIKFEPSAVTTLYSATPDKDASIADFKSGAKRFMVAHPRSAAHGLTFVRCHAMVFYGLDYSHEAHQQAMKRIHRIGQNSTCLYVYLIAQNSIDEDIRRVLDGKERIEDVMGSYLKK